ncbi:carboxymuconolactone decarboxylase family protein [Fodinicurvata halophila]|uniref:Carboxymuconolactone decarboxylase family protein n=1 Tax=Fodinicurvata halophila TaxID=1419723 RepID=A0ABV8UM52_9PROT
MSQPKNGFQVHHIEDAPEESRETLQAINQAYGFLPNLMGIVSESPAALKAYVTLNRLFKEESAFSQTEAELVLLIISAHNGCGYCVAAHSAGGERAGVDAATLEDVRQQRELSDPKLQALAAFTRKLIDARGWVEHKDVDAFLQTGYSHRHLLDLLTALAMKTISNYTNHIAETPLDEALSAKAWKEAS